MKWTLLIFILSACAHPCVKETKHEQVMGGLNEINKIVWSLRVELEQLKEALGE